MRVLEPTCPAGLSNQAIQEYARRVGDHHDIYDANGHANIDDFVERLGGTAKYATDNESLHVLAPGRFTIYLPQFTSARRDRFTKAHELGHYFLHYLYPGHSGEMHYGRGARDRAETEANVFASALLMPADKFKAAHQELMGDSWKLAARFDVSPQAASVRAEVLGLHCD